MKIIHFLAVILICTGIYGFTGDFTDTVKTELEYDTSLLESHGVIRVGVLYKLKPGWHIYWKNSGDSGLPTKIEFTLPEGFESGEIQWPLPHAYERDGDILDYGYEKEVLLWSDIKIPSAYKEQTIPVSIKTKWISCEEICIPGKSEFTQKLTLNHKNKLFDSWIEKIPSQKNIPFDIKVVNSGDITHIVINNKGIGNNFKLFPNPGKAIELDSISYKNNDNNQSDISFTVNIYPGHEVKTNKIDTVISYTDIENKQKGFEYSINLDDLIVKN